jgi:threonine dehydratase
VVRLEDVHRAREAVYRVARRTPLLPCEPLSARIGGEVLLKAECLQRTGSFKVRGAANKLASLSPDERRRGVIAASAGNHAQGVALAARILGVPSTVVMPEGAAIVKVAATREHGAEIVLHGENFADAWQRANDIAEERGLIPVPPYDDESVIAGQGTIGTEVAEEAPDAAEVIVPVGGGGLIAGVALALKTLRPEVKIVGVQAAAAPAAAVSFGRGRRSTVRAQPTIADGVAVEAPGRITFPLIRRYVDDLVTVDEESIAQAIVLLLERAKLVVEGAGALGVAALLAGAARPAASGATVVLLSGGNIDVNVLASVVQHGLLHFGRYLTLRVGVEDRPGALASILSIIAATGANVLDVDHLRQGIHLPVRGVEVRLLLETRDEEHIMEIVERLTAAGYVETGGDGTSYNFAPRGWLE